MTIKPLSSWPLNQNERVIIAGPCSAESREQILKTAKALANLPISIFRAGVWKPRSRPETFQGAGEVALDWHKEAAEILQKPVAVEVMTPDHVELCLKKKIDVLWIGARTVTNPFAVEELAQALKGVDIPLLIKNPLIPDLSLWSGAIERFLNRGISRLAAIHRGFYQDGPTSFRYPPIWRLPIELKQLFPSLPLICDPSHMSGDRQLVPLLCQKASELLYDGLMIECHISPQLALSDREQQLSPEELSHLLSHLVWKKESLSGQTLELHQLREKIDEVDKAILNLLSRRMEWVRQVGKIKKEKNLSSYSPSRWNEVIQSRMSLAKELGLDPACVAEIWQQIHQEALRQQEEESLLEDGPGLDH